MKLRFIQLVSVLLVLALPLGRRHIFSNISPQVAGTLSPYASVVMFGADILVLLLILLVIKGLKSLKNKGNLFVLLFFLWNLAIFLVFPRETLYDAFILLKLFEILAIFSIFSYVSRDEKVLSPILWAFSVSGLIQAAIGIGQFVAQRSLGLKIAGETVINAGIQGIAKIQTQDQLFIRPYGTLDHPNQLGAFLLVACATSIYLLITSKRGRTKLSAAVIFIICAFAEFLTFSRAGIGGLGIMLATFVTIYFIDHKWGHEMKSLLAIIFLALAIPIISLFPQLTTRTTLVDSATNQRIQYDKIGLEIIKEHPFFGVGPGNQIFYVEQKLINTHPWQVQPPHSYFLIVASETGVIGFLLFLLFILQLLFRNTRRIKKDRGTTENSRAKYSLALALLLSFSFLMLFDHYFYDLPQTQLLLWVILGIITGIVSRETVLES